MRNGNEGPALLWWHSLDPVFREAHCPIAPPPHPTYDIRKVIEAALSEDAGTLGDITSLATVSPETQATGTFLAKAPGVLAGVGVATLVFAAVDPQLQVTWSARDGDPLAPGQRFGAVSGPARSILVAERIALNFMQRMSGVATATRAMVEAVAQQGGGGGKTKVLETRKTAPGLRLLDKWGVLIGGGCNHRMGLYDLVMIKDNHVTAAGGISAAVRRAEEYLAAAGLAGAVGIEVETRSLEEVEEVLQVLKQAPHSSVKRVMLDNMTRRGPDGLLNVDMLHAAVAKIGGAVETEASGNVELATVAQIAATGVDFVSCGRLTHSVEALDISLKIAL